MNPRLIMPLMVVLFMSGCANAQKQVMPVTKNASGSFLCSSPLICKPTHYAWVRLVNRRDSIKINHDPTFGGKLPAIIEAPGASDGFVSGSFFIFNSHNETSAKYQCENNSTYSPGRFPIIVPRRRPEFTNHKTQQLVFEDAIPADKVNSIADAIRKKYDATLTGKTLSLNLSHLPKGWSASYVNISDFLSEIFADHKIGFLFYNCNKINDQDHFDDFYESHFYYEGEGGYPDGKGYLNAYIVNLQ